MPDFRIPNSFLSNIGEDLQDSHELAEIDFNSHHETGVVCLDTEDLPEVAKLKRASATLSSSTSRLMEVQVSLQIR